MIKQYQINRRKKCTFSCGLSYSPPNLIVVVVVKFNDSQLEAAALARQRLACIQISIEKESNDNNNNNNANVNTSETHACRLPCSVYAAYEIPCGILFHLIRMCKCFTGLIFVVFIIFSLSTNTQICEKSALKHMQITPSLSPSPPPLSPFLTVSYWTTFSNKHIINAFKFLFDFHLWII